MNSLSNAVTNLIHFDGKKAFVTSLDISNRFQKQHKDVLKAIDNLSCTMEFKRRNFAPVAYRDAKGEMRPSYHIMRDGFVFLCMGFTGPQAAPWKERYIEAFNLMEARLMASSEGQDKALQTMATSMDKMANSVSKLADGMDLMLDQNNRTDRYIGLLEMNQQGHVKVTEAVRLEVFELFAQGMPQASIARYCRIGKATVNQLLKGTYGSSLHRNKESFDAAMEKKMAEMIEEKIAAEKQSLQ